jgi:hypothetical protein
LVLDDLENETDDWFNSAAKAMSLVISGFERNSRR